MYHIQLNKLLKRPMYLQIVESLRKSISTGQLQFGDRLPTEKEVCELLDLSVIVVKQAYDMLVAEKLIERIKGKGTFVTARTPVQIPINQFYRHDSYWGYPTKRKLFVFDKIKSEPQVFPYLKMKAGEWCFVYKTLALNSKNALYFQRVYLPFSYYPSMSIEMATELDLLTILNTKGMSKPARMMHHFAPITLGQLEADLLTLPLGASAHLMRTQVYDDKNDVIAYIINIIPGEFVELEVNVQ